MDIVKRIRNANRDRDPERLAMKYRVAGKKKWRRAVALAADAMARRTALDWTVYCSAHDAGQFAPVAAPEAA
jgi:hypothetical protein